MAAAVLVRHWSDRHHHRHSHHLPARLARLEPADEPEQEDRRGHRLCISLDVRPLTLRTKLLLV